MTRNENEAEHQTRTEVVIQDELEKQQIFFLGLICNVEEQ